MPKDRVIKYTDSNGQNAQFILEKKIGAGVFGKLLPYRITFGIRIQKFVLIRHIGEVFIAYLGECDPELKKKLPQVFACKKVKLQYPEEYEEMKEREVKLSNNVKSSHNIYLYCAVKVDQVVYFFFHFYNGGMLTAVIEGKEGDIPEKLAAQILHQVLIGLMELHDKKYVHRDLKPDNVLMHFPCMMPNKSLQSRFHEVWDHEKFNVFSAVVADLGMGREEGLTMTEGAGTPLYRAPECEAGFYNSKADVLSIGIICYELLFGEPIFTQAKARNLDGKFPLLNFRSQKTVEEHHLIH